MNCDDYVRILFDLCDDHTEQIFEIHMQKFVDEKSFYEWQDIVKEINLTVHIDDGITVGHYISAFNQKYDENVSELDVRKYNKQLSVALNECTNKPNNLQTAVA